MSWFRELIADMQIWEVTLGYFVLLVICAAIVEGVREWHQCKKENKDNY